MKRLLAFVVAIVMVFSLVACDQEVLSAPSNITVSDQGVISWDSVANATHYKVVIGDNTYTTDSTSYTVTDLSTAFSCYVIATAEGYIDSLPSSTATFTPAVQPPPVDDINVTITGKSQVKSNQSITLSAVVTGTANTQVVWSISQGSEYATVSQEGVVTANQVTGDKLVTVVATSQQDNSVVASKAIKIVARQQLTQEMLNSVGEHTKVSFEGYVNISLYTMGLFERLVSTQATVVKTAMDGEYWYAEYDNLATYSKNSLYYKKHNDKACQIGISFTNQESYEPMLDDNGNEISWTDAGLYSSFGQLSIDDFAFNEDSWRWEYIGNDNTVMDKMIASANPYDFQPISLSLLLDDGEVVGIQSVAADDFTLAENYKAVQELFVLINTGEDVVVPKIGRYSTEEIHTPLTQAIENMRNLNSYTTDFKEMTASAMSQGVVESGYVETVTTDLAYMRPYTVSYDRQGNEIRNFADNSAYGYKQVADNLYNSFLQLDDGTYQATRAYNGSIDEAKPSFEFAAEIFRTYYIDEEAGTTTYYVDELMSRVATTWYYGVGNDINLYGIFAQRGYTSATESFTPYVVVKDGYITEAVFYYYLGSMYGVVEINYSDFDNVTPYQATFDTRQVPTSWDQLEFFVSNASGGTGDDVPVNALTYLKEFYQNENIADVMPFFGLPLGDTFGFGLTTYRINPVDKKSNAAVVLYYDVPLEIDYSINRALRSVSDYLLSLGFVKDSTHDVFTKDNIVVNPVDSSLDLMIYIWKSSSASTDNI